MLLHVLLQQQQPKKQQIDSRLRAIIFFRQTELSKLFVYGHTNE